MLTASGKQRRRKIESDAEHSGHPAITDRAAALVRPGDVGERLNEYATVYAARRALRREQQEMDEAKSSIVHLHKRHTRSAPTANRECASAVGADRAAGRSARTDQGDACAIPAADSTAATSTGHRSASPPADAPPSDAPPSDAPPSASAPGSPASCTSYTSCAASPISPARAAAGATAAA